MSYPPPEYLQEAPSPLSWLLNFIASKGRMFHRATRNSDSRRGSGLQDEKSKRDNRVFQGNQMDHLGACNGRLRIDLVLVRVLLCASGFAT